MSETQLHVRARKGEVAAAALLVGDPGRARRCAGMLDRAACYNEHRGLLGFTGRWRGTPVSVQTTGMGGPSAAIVTEELANLGVTTVIRAGTCGAVAAHVGVLDLAVATASVPMCGTTRQYLEGDPFAPVADFAVTRALVDAAAEGERAAHMGLFISEDAFYHQADDWERWRRRGVIAVEMEAAAIFTVALHRGLRAGCICLAVDRVGAHETWANDADIAAGEDAMLRIALDAAVAPG
ncbi:MAG: purine-nucleoside phosphorylase [Chloroflexi bacterium]|nr:purine-nucleoside phosphorylase [Chloroflexota bacterium]